MDSVVSALMVSSLMTPGVGTADLFVQQNVIRNGFLSFFLSQASHVWFLYSLVSKRLYNFFP